MFDDSCHGSFRNVRKTLLLQLVQKESEDLTLELLSYISSLLVDDNERNSGI